MTASADTARATELRRILADNLVAEGLIRSPQWRDAFASVPRHRLVPEPVYLNVDGGWEPVTSADPRWLDLVYGNATLVTQLDNGDQTPGGVPSVPTSSSTAPGLMALMLEALDVGDGHRVLEIGTGTGYNAALLSHRLGADQVTTVEVDPGVARTASERLSSAGYTPAVVTGDGAKGHPAGGPYDRIIATCSVPGVPSAWLAQGRPGCVILANVYRGVNSSALARLTVRSDGIARGRFLGEAGSFMPARAHAHPGRDHVLHTAALAAPPDGERPARLGPDVVHHHDVGLLIDFRADVTDVQWFTPVETGREQTWLLSPDGSWAYLAEEPSGELLAYQGGPRRLWDQVEAAYELWVDLGRPARDRFGLTATPTGHVLWLDDPNGGNAWAIQDWPGR